jgi:alkylhydroperoxidase/carboxymuconolactone decarboxylase family protein YurZ
MSAINVLEFIEGIQHECVRMISQNEIDRQVSALLEGVPDGDDLDAQQIILINYALRACSSVLDVAGANEWAARALATGVTTDQLHEVVTLQSAIGVHVFFESSRELASLARPAEGWGAFDYERQALWDTYVGNREYWTSMQTEIEGFLESLLWMSPSVFEAWMQFVGLPFKTRLVPNLTKELIAMASDACPAHQYLPGMRMHLRNAVRGGAGRLAIQHTLRIAAVSPSHVGVA